MNAPKQLLVFVVALCCVFSSTSVFSQQKDNAGKEFYLAFGTNQGGGIDDNSFQLYITGKTATKGTVEVKALSFVRNFTVTPGQITTVDLPSDGSGGPTVELTESDEEQIIKGMAVHITADEEVAVYGMNHKIYSTDAFMGIPIDVLGTEYITINYQTCNSGNGGQNSNTTPGEFWLVATNDSTNVTITPRARTRAGVQAGTPIPLLLYKGDVYLVHGDKNSPTNDLTGSIIESDQPLAVFSGHVRAAIPQGFLNKGGNTTSRDHLVEQLPPVSAWGDSALVVRYASSDLADLVRIVSAEDDNQITVNGNVVATLSKGSFFEIKALTGPTSIHATNPILVGQYMHTSVYGTVGGGQPYGDPALALVYPVEQFANSYTFISVVNPVYTGNYVNVVTLSSAGMMLDGVAIPASAFSPIPNSNYLYAQIDLDQFTKGGSGQGTHNITGPNPFGITIYGLGAVDSYAYTGGTLLKTITPFKTVGVVIDFGDRLLGPAPGYSGFWDTTVFIQNISSDPLLITGFNKRSGDFTKFDVTRPANPISIGAGGFDSITIRFTPNEPDRRMHTTINAQTEHLRAYVVDVYGRGILNNLQVFSDSSSKRHIDTLDFGVFEQTDPAKDSMVFISNKGSAPLPIDAAPITGLNAADFSLVTIDTAQKTITVPFVLPVASQAPARTQLRFTPSAPNGIRTALLDVTSVNGTHRLVVLLAKVQSIFKPTITSIPFDSVLLCTEQDRTVTVLNSNDFDITVTDALLGGTDAAEFSIVTPQPPFSVPANGSRTVVLRCAPSNVGLLSADVTFNFNVPKGYSVTQPLSISASQLSSSFWASKKLHTLPGEDVLLPIYANSPLEKFQSPSFRLTISYDPSHLEDFDYVQDYTHTSLGAFSVVGDTAGYREYDYQTLDNSIVTGGMPNDTMPLVYIKFHTRLNPGEEQLTFSQSYDIQYSINFDRSPFPSACVLLSTPSGVITIDSSCASVSLFKPLHGPDDAEVQRITPNPSTTGIVTVTIDVPSDSPVRLDVIDVLGNTIKTLVNEDHKRGYYDINWNTEGIPAGSYFLRLRTSGAQKLRQVLIMH